MEQTNFQDLRKHNGEICNIDLNVHSQGLFQNGVQDFLKYSLPRLQLQISSIFILTQSLHLLFKRFNLPRSFSEILAGIILGRTILGHILGESHAKLFPEEDVLLDILTKIGFMFFMFLVGVKMDPSLVLKSGRKGISIGICTSLIPLFVANLVTTEEYLSEFLAIYRRPAIMSIVRISVLTPFPVIASLLIDLKIMNSELGRLSLATALISDMINVVINVFSGCYRIYVAGYGLPVSIIMLFQNLLVTLVALCTRPLFSMIIKQTPEGKAVKNTYIVLICGAVLGLAVASDNVGMSYIFGPFLMGIVLPSGPPLGSTLSDKLETFVSGLLAPLVLTYCAIKIDLTMFYDFSFLRIVCVYLLGATALKFLVVFLLAMINKVPIRDAVTLGIIMGAQGTVHGAFYESTYKNQSIDTETFSLLILSLLITALLAHLLVHFLYGTSRTYIGYQKRNILHTSLNAELRVLVCAHRNDDAMAIVKLLQVTNPTKESPLAIYALHLVELVGRATPLLINHGLGQKNATGTHLRAQQVIDLFQNFGDNYQQGVNNIQTFTAMSLPKFMHHDICSLAFDKLVSIIILPFHRKWSQQGKVIFDSGIQRGINQQVLAMAPCSVGILIDRRKLRNQGYEDSSYEPNTNDYHVGVIFFGSSDDREMLAYAKRMMMKALGVHLTVVRFVSGNAGLENQWDNILDTEALRDVKLQASRQNNIAYREVKSKDGPDTALLINKMIENDDFDLIMVGRRPTESSPLLTGLTEWSDLPELGPIGDILASSDIQKPVSILVLQQQILMGK